MTDNNTKMIQMVIDNSIMQYLDSVDDSNIDIAHVDGDNIFVNMMLVTDVVMKAHSLIVDGENEQAIAGSALITDMVLSMGQIIASRYMDITPESILGNSDD